MTKKQINDLNKSLLSLELNENISISSINMRQFELLYSHKYSYVRNYISWLFKHGRSIFEIAYFVRPCDNLISCSYVRLYNNACVRFSSKLTNDFLCFLTYIEFKWLCANIKFYL